MRGAEFAQLQALATIVEFGSFSRAAEQLRISRSALSQTIRLLEKQLGMSLLARTTRSVAPTEAGARLLARFIPAMAEMNQAVDDARKIAGSPAGSVRIHAQRLGYDLFLAPLLQSFGVAYPKIVLDITIDDSVVDIVAKGFDVGLRLGELLDQDMVAVKLGSDIRQVAVASPDYLHRHGRPHKPSDLLAHRCIGFRWPGQQAIYDWEFKGDGAWFTVAIRPSLVINDQRAGLEAAVAGAGIAFWAESEVASFVRTGELELLLDDWSPAFPGFFLFVPPQQQRSTALQAFVAFMRKSA